MALTQQWKCQDNAASTTIVATVGTNATLAGGNNTADITTTGPGTALTAALDLDGSADYGDFSASSVSFAADTAFSFALWFNLDATTVQGFFGIAASNNSTIRLASSTSILVRTGANSTFTIPAVNTGTWYHLLVTRTAGNSLRLFLDGVESSTGALSNNGVFAPTWFGNQNGNFLNGRVADARVYNSDESANVAAIMAEKDTAASAFPWHHYQQMMVG